MIKTGAKKFFYLNSQRQVDLILYSQVSNVASVFMNEMSYKYTTNNCNNIAYQIGLSYTTQNCVQDGVDLKKLN